MILKVIKKMTKNLVIMNVIMKSEDVMRIWLLKFNNHCLCSDCRNLNKYYLIMKEIVVQVLVLVRLSESQIHYHAEPPD